MILLFLLAFLPLSNAAQNTSCPPDEACLYFTVCYGEIRKVDLLDFDASSAMQCDIDLPAETIELGFRPTSANDLSVRLKSNSHLLDNVTFAMNAIRFDFDGKTARVKEDEKEIGTHLVIESAAGDPIVGHLTLKTKEPAYIAFANLTVSKQGRNKTWNLPEFAERLAELTPCDQSHIVQACEQPDCQATLVDAGRKYVCANNAKKLWLFTRNYWTEVENIACKNAHWTANHTILQSQNLLICKETAPTIDLIVSACGDLAKSCLDDSKCITVTSTRVTCASTLRIDTSSNAFYRNWESISEIVCIGDRWHWRPQAGPSEPKPIEDKKISCSADALSKTTALLSWTIGGSIVGFLVFFFAVAACCYLRIKRTRRADGGSSRTGGTDTSLGVLPSSARVVDANPKSWKWPEPDSKRVIVPSEATPKDSIISTAPAQSPKDSNSGRPFSPPIGDEKSRTVENTTFSGKSAKKSAKKSSKK